MPDRPRQVFPSQDPIEIADRLHSAAIHLLRRLRIEDDASGLSAPRLSALSVVVFGGPISVTGLAAAEQVRPPTISRLIKDLEHDGLVRRRKSTEDERVQLVEATKKGRTVLQEGRRRRVARLASDLQELASSDLQILSNATDLLHQLTSPLAKGQPK